MLRTSVFIFQPASIGGGQYTMELFFTPSPAGQFLNLLDVVEDTAGNQYRIDSATLPFMDGGTITTTQLTNDVLPVEDSDFDSEAFTPGQIDKTPEVRTSGSLGNSTLFSGPDYEYTLIAGWNDPVQADRAQVGDSIVDISGKELSITFLGANRFNEPIRISEVERVGISPAVGEATLYRSTSLGYFQGTALSDPARTTIFNRDQVDMDADLSEIFVNIMTLQQSGGSGGALTKSMRNVSGSTIGAGVPVSKASDGSIYTADSDAVNGQQFIGISTQPIANNSNGIVALVGNNLVDVLQGLGISPGSEVFLDESGGYTTDPSGFSGSNDSIIKLGVADCSADEAVAVGKDLIIFPEVIARP